MRGQLKPIRTRFYRRFIPEPNTGCWLWIGEVDKTTGYGIIQDASGRRHGAHRISHRLHTGPIPDGLHVDHKCRVRSCVNPAHLRAVTQRENILASPEALAGKFAARTHCAHGHEFSPSNTHWVGRTRRCRACAAERTRKYRAHRNQVHV